MNQSLGRALDRSGILDGHCEIVPSDGQGLINHALKAKALLSDSDCGRRFGSVLRQHISKSQPFLVGFFLGPSNEKPESLPSSPGAGGGLGWFMAGNSIGQAPLAICLPA